MKSEVIKAFLVSRLVVVGIAYGFFYFSMLYSPLPFAPPNYVEERNGTLDWRPLNILYYYDAIHYLDIAQNGYRLHPYLTCWFPLYPILIRFLGNTTASAVVVSNLSLLIALFAIYRLGGKKAVWLTAFSPISIVFSSAYTESLFLALTAWSMVMVKREKPLLCGILIGLSALTRPVGWAVLAGISLHVFLERKKANAVKIVLIGSVIAGLYPLYLYFQFGDPLLFSKMNTIIFGRTLFFPFSGLFIDIKYAVQNPWILVMLLINIMGFVMLAIGMFTPWRAYVIIYALTILSLGSDKFIPSIIGLLRYACACVPVYLNQKMNINLSWVIFSIIISVLVTFKMFIF